MIFSRIVTAEALPPIPGLSSRGGFFIPADDAPPIAADVSSYGISIPVGGDVVIIPWARVAYATAQKPAPAAANAKKR